MVVLKVFKERLYYFNPSGDSYRRPVAFLMCTMGVIAAMRKRVLAQQDLTICGADYYFYWPVLFLISPAVSLDSTLESRDEHTQNYTKTAKSSANQSTIRVVMYPVLFWSNLVCAGPV